MKNDPYNASNALLSDILMNYRTVISFGEKNVEYLMSRYDQLLTEPNRIGIRNAHWSGLFFGYSQFIRFGYLAFVFYIASMFIIDYHEDPKNTYIGVYILFVSAMGTGLAMSEAPSVSKAKESAEIIFSIIEEKSQIDTRDTTGIRTIEHGAIELKDAVFTYPSR